MKTTTSEQFPSCTFYDVAQRSPDWYDLRKGCLTASNAGEWLTEQPECRMTVPEIKEACHYTNLQPLWAEENLSKGATIQS